MDYLLTRLQPLIENLSNEVENACMYNKRGKKIFNKDKVCCDPLTQEMADQAQAIRKIGYELNCLSKGDIAYIEKFTKVYNQMCIGIIALENGKRSAFNAAAKEFEDRFTQYNSSLKGNLGKNYALLSKEVKNAIKEPSASELHFPSVSQLSPSYSSAQLSG